LTTNGDDIAAQTFNGLHMSRAAEMKAGMARMRERMDGIGMMGCWGPSNRDKKLQ
jgi:hypothetical protein